MRQLRVSGALATAVSVGLGASHARAVVIDFDSVPGWVFNVDPGTITDTYYPGVTFSSQPGYHTRAAVYSGPAPYSPANVLVPFNTNTGFPYALADLYVDFSPAVNGLTFLAVAADEFGVIARVNVYTAGNVLLGTDDIIGTANAPNTFGNGSTLVNLSAYSNITRIEIVPPIGQTVIDYAYGGGGIAYDNFTFEQVPAPGALGLLAICAIAARRRRA